MRGLSRERTLDLLCALPTLLICGLAIPGFGIQIFDLARTGISPSSIAAIGVRLASALFAGLQIAMLCIRQLPVAKLRRWRARGVALLGANSAALLLLLPRSDAVEVRNIASALITIVGLLFASVSLWHLGRAFAVFPQARRLVTTGPYAYVRHPLYVAESIAAFGVMLQYRQPWALLTFVFGVSLQFARMHFEEQILQHQFLDYARYAQHTARWLPKLF